MWTEVFIGKIYIFYLSFKSCFLYFIFNLYAQCGTQAYNPDIKSCVLYQLRQPGIPYYFIDFLDSNFCI